MKYKMIVYHTVFILFICLILFVITFYKNKQTVVQVKKEMTCPIVEKNFAYIQLINNQNEIEVIGEPQFIDNPQNIKINKPFNIKEFEKGLYKYSATDNGWESREFDVTGDGKAETIINANVAMNHTPHIALVVENGNIIFEANGANVWIDKVSDGKGFLMRVTNDWSSKDYRLFRYVYKDGGFMQIWSQKSCGVVFE